MRRCDTDPTTASGRTELTWRGKRGCWLAVGVGVGVGLCVAWAQAAQQIDTQPVAPGGRSQQQPGSSEPGESAPDSVGRTALPPDQRPSFMLPDIVVEGEDLRRLTGGVRLLDLEMPGVTPQQEPRPVEPGTTAYARRTRLPFSIQIPESPTRRLLRGLLHFSGESSPGGRANMALMPAADGSTLLWCAVDGWHDRLPGNRRWHATGGVHGVWNPLQPNRRVGLGLGVGSISWDADEGSASTPELRGGDQRWIGIHGLWQQRLQPFGLRGILGLRGRHGQMRTQHDAGPSTSGGIVQRGRWASAEVTWATDGMSRDERALRASCLSPELARAWSGTRPLAALEAGVAWRANPEDSVHTGARAEALLGLSRTLSLGLIGLGITWAGDEDQKVLAPYLALETSTKNGGLRLRFEATPRISYADELLFDSEANLSGGASMSARGEHRLETFGVVGRDLSRAARPSIERAGAGPQLPRSASCDPLACAQVAWPRLLGEALHRGKAGWLRVAGIAAEVERPLGWVPTMATSAPAPTSEASAYRLSNLGDRRLIGLQADVGLRLSQRVEIRLLYAWSRDEMRASTSALAFLPEHELAASVNGQMGSFLWGASAHLRGDAPAGGNLDPLASFVNLATSLGWSFDHARILLTAENLLDEDVRYRPGDGMSERWVRLAWEQSFDVAAP